MKFSEMVNNQRIRNTVTKYKLEEDRYKEGSWYPEWRPSDEIFYTMYQDGFRYDHSGGEPLYPGSWEKGFRTLEEACIYTVKYFQNHRDSGVRANDLHVVQINGTIYGSEDVGDPEGYEGDWYSYAKVRNIAKRASNIPDADESYDASARKSKSDMGKNDKVFKEHADRDLFGDISYMLDACANEIDSVAEALYNNDIGNIDFKCPPEQYLNKLEECKKMADWLVDNISVNIYIS